MQTAIESPPAPARSGLALAGFALAVLAAASLGGLAAAGARDTYDALDLPPFAPPGWLFGPVWTVLYVIIAISFSYVLWQCLKRRMPWRIGS